MKYIIALFLALLLGVAQGQEMLKGKVVVAQGICENDTKQYNCLLVADLKNKDIGWVVLIGDNGEPSVVLELNPKTGKAKVVWKKQKYL